MTACTFCGAGEETRRFLMQARTSGARLCDQCLCDYANKVAFVTGVEPPRGLARLGIEAPKMWPLERQLRRINFLQRTGQLNVPKRLAGAIARGLARFERRAERTASPLSVYFVRPTVRPFAHLERDCAFCGTSRRSGFAGTSGRKICVPCVEHAARTLLG